MLYLNFCEPLFSTFEIKNCTVKLPEIIPGYLRRNVRRAVNLHCILNFHL